MLRRALLPAVAASLCLVASAAAGLPEVGTPAPPFTLAAVDGAPFELAPGPQKTPLLLAFVSVACKSCEDCSPVLNELYERYGRAGQLRIAYVALCSEGAARWLVKSGKQSSRIPVLVEKVNGGRFVTADAYGVTTTPAFVLVGRRGMVRWRYEGPLTLEAVEVEVRKTLAQAP